MTELNREMIETLVRQIVTEKLMPTKQVDPSGIMSIKLPEIDVKVNKKFMLYTFDLGIALHNSLSKETPLLIKNAVR